MGNFYWKKHFVQKICKFVDKLGEELFWLLVPQPGVCTNRIFRIWTAAASNRIKTEFFTVVGSRLDLDYAFAEET